jgi:GNAT superfamily N-acetyltransferase
MAELGAFFGNPNLQRQGARARALAGQRDVNTLADPRTYAIVQGLLGTRPDEMGFSVLNPDYEKIKKAAEPAFALGLLGQAAPLLAPLTKGLPVGASIKSLDDIFKKYPDVTIDASVGKKDINLSRIVVPREMRNQGVGTQVMSDLSEYADSLGKRITLTPSSDFGGSVPKLKTFYKELGFVENKGKNKDFSTREAMYREPQAVEQSVKSEYPLAPAGTRYEEFGGELTYMTPDEYLSRVRPLTLDEESLDNIAALKSHVQSGGQLDPLHIYQSGIEDGRHRAYMAKELGIERIPVALHSEANNLGKNIPIEEGLLAVQKEQPLQGLLQSKIPSPSSLTMPDVPTVEQMQKYGRVETVPLSQAVSFQSARTWDKFNKGEHAGDLVKGFGDKPLALRLENGEYIIYDGNHRTDLAMQAGKTELPMNVIDVKSYDPSNAGRRPVPPSMSDDELLRSLLE